jgi:RNA polymerase sigma-70 factor (ECF subfamily)
MTFEEAGQHLSVALEAAVSRYGAMVRQVGRKYRLDESDLDEVMQEVRIRLWRARGTSEMVGEANTSYIYRTASTAALDVLRRRRARQADRHDPIEEGPVAVLSAPTPDPHGVLEGSELASKVAQAIETIAESRRPAVRMHLAGYPREEIASLMGWTEAKTRNLLYRGLADLRERHVRDPVTRRVDDLDFDLQTRMRIHQERLDVFGLPECERAAARSDYHCDCAPSRIC